MIYYKLAGKRSVLTAHNVNTRKRDGTDSWLNRFTLKLQYRLANHIFVHTQKMKTEIITEFGVTGEKISVVPFGINNTVPKTSIRSADARLSLGLSSNDKVILSYGQIAPYKGLEYLIAAFAEVLRKDANYRLIIAGRPKWNDTYWRQIEQCIVEEQVRHRVIERIEHVPDNETELYFKAADVLILPYVHIFQSGVLFLGYSFGLPAIVADVGNLKEEISEGETGFVCNPRDSADLAAKIDEYFNSELFRDLENRRLDIKEYANERYSWTKVAEITTTVYSNLLPSR